MILPGIYASQISGHLYNPTGQYYSIATATVDSGGASSITFSSIPSTYTHLQLRCLSKTGAAGTDEIYIRFNSDTGSNYSYHQLYGSGSSAAASAATSTSVIKIAETAGSGTGANIFGVSVVDILDHANTNKYKTVRSLDGVDGNGSGYVILNSGNWRSTSAITSIDIFNWTATNFSQYTQFALYGIKD